MKTQHILGAALLAFVFANTASAQTPVIRIGGAQAFGDAVHRAIAHLLGAADAPPYTLSPGNTYAYTGTDINKAQKSVWSGTVNGNSVIIETSFTGSTDGIRLVSLNLPVNFLKTTTPQSSSGTSNTTDSAANWDFLSPDSAAVDSFQESTVYSSPLLVDRQVGAGAYLFVASKDAPVGASAQSLAVSTVSASTTATVTSTSGLVRHQAISGNPNIPNGTYIANIVDGTTFALSAAATASASNVSTNFAAYAGLTNISTQLAQALYNVGNLPLSLFTGSAEDRIDKINPSFHTAGITYPAPLQVFATGRDYGSGARIITFIETGIGGESNVQQYQPAISGSAIISHALYPAITINGILFPLGSDGNTSNGNLATSVLNKSTLATLGGIYISYLPSLDAANAVSAGAHALSYNGVPYSTKTVAEGAYSLWAYEHILYKSSVTDIQKDVLDTLSDQLLNVDATLLLSSLNVTRPLIDGGVITGK